MKQLIGKMMMRLLGWSWRLDVDLAEIQKSVIVCAPHTSNWDFFYAVFGFWALDLPIKVFIKESHVNAWYGGLIKWLGGIPVNRNQAANLVDYSAKMLHEADRMALLITPEGTRAYAPKWKKGFYYIARKADVPIALGIGNYKAHQAQVVKTIDPMTHSLEEVMDICEETFKAEYAKYPENYNPKIY